LEIERTRATNAEREADVVRRANALLRKSERQRQDEIAGLKADLAFYRRLGGASGSQAALAVHHMELQTTHSPRVYLLVITLTQNLRWASSIAGAIHLGVDDPLKFQFKYFQQFERLITLPEGFAADRLTIRLRSGSLGTAVEQTMQWQDMFIQSAPEPASEAPIDD